MPVVGRNWAPSSVRKAERSLTMKQKAEQVIERERERAHELALAKLAAPVVQPPSVITVEAPPTGDGGWMAGGGLNRGVVHGATDEIGFHAVENRHYVTDLHATLLTQLGLDPKSLEIPGRKRLEIDFGTPIREIMA